MSEPHRTEMMHTEGTSQNIHFDYEIRDGAVRLTGFHGSGKKIVIPEQIGGLPVRVIGARSFYDDGMYIEEIQVPGTVRVIEPCAFELCVSLEKLILADGVEEIGAGATLATALETLPIPPSVRVIEGIREMTCALVIDPANPHFRADGYALYKDGVLLAVNPHDGRRAYAIAPGTRGIAPGAFDNQPHLKSLHLPASLAEAPEGVFANVREPFAIETGIGEVTVDPENPVFFLRDGALYRRITSEGDRCTLVRACAECPSQDGREDRGPEQRSERGGTRELILQEDIIRIEEAACLRSGIRRVTIPSSVASIGEDAFALCPLEEAVLCGDDCMRIFFPQSDSFLLKNLLQGFGANGLRYDFAEYDRTLAETHLNPDRVRMILSRLDNLVGETAKSLQDERTEQPGNGNHEAGWRPITPVQLRRILADRITEIVLFCAEAGDIDLLASLADHDFFTSENIGALIERVNETEHREACAFLMDHSHRYIASASFDFDL